jgi:hypothetical protein
MTERQVDKYIFELHCILIHLSLLLLHYLRRAFVP